MAWINEQAFFERCLRNEIISLEALRTATTVMAIQHGTQSEAEATLKKIDDAITATRLLIDGGSHHP